MSGGFRFETVPASDIVPGDTVAEPTTGATAVVRSVEPGPHGPRLVFGLTWCVSYDCATEQPMRRLQRA